MSDDLSGDMLAPSWPNLVLLVFSHVANFRYVANFRFLTLQTCISGVMVWGSIDFSVPVVSFQGSVFVSSCITDFKYRLFTLLHVSKQDC